MRLAWPADDGRDAPLADEQNDLDSCLQRLSQPRSMTCSIETTRNTVNFVVGMRGVTGGAASESVALGGPSSPWPFDQAPPEFLPLLVASLERT